MIYMANGILHCTTADLTKNSDAINKISYIFLCFLEHIDEFSYLFIFRGVYLGCYFCYEDKVLVTSEEQVPIVEVDENFASPSLHPDLYWLMKVACTWEDVKSLRQDMERSTAEGKVHFRGKLLQAISVLQVTMLVFTVLLVLTRLTALKIQEKVISA